MSDFNHFILTQFNVPRPYSEGKGPLEEGYLRRRFQLFDDFCFPSVLGQTNQSFKWLVFFDARTPEPFKDKIRRYQGRANFIPVYMQENENLMDRVSAAIRENLGPGADHLITTNLDNDDAIAKDFVETVQKNFKLQDFMFLSLVFGYEYNLGERELRLREYYPNPFISLIEKSENCQTVWSISHHLLDKEVRPDAKKYVIAKPAWLQVVHETNVRNRRDVNSVWQPLERLSDRFTINPDCLAKVRTSPRKVFEEISRILASRKKGLARKIKNIFAIITPDFIRMIKNIYHKPRLTD